MAGEDRVAVVLGGGADIGSHIAKRLIEAGKRVVATYRSEASKARLVSLGVTHALEMDAGDPDSVARLQDSFGELGLEWDILFSSVGTMEPIGKFFDVPFQDWSKSLQINALGQVGALHALSGFRAAEVTNQVCFLAGGGTNNPFRNYSAYCVSKIFLIKMCELIDDEYPDINCFIVGPGYVATKIHDETLRNKDTAGENYMRTLEFLDTPGTDLDNVYDSILWCMDQGRAVMGGRNLSTKHDAWRDGGSALAARLMSDRNIFKLRRVDVLEKPGG
ncbi:SDR family oxidoreductase [Nisaea sp.]|uniref:SDR family NAD(P)-dependent oxidoreductase n=1 Tax=Nisaea sp. TaxID=2024842 RepID=UPI0032EC2C7A